MSDPQQEELKILTSAPCLPLYEVRQGRSLVYKMWHDSQTPNSRVLFSYTAPLDNVDMTVAEFLVAYDKGGHATRPRGGASKPRLE